MPVITYITGIIDWNKKDIQHLDRMTRKVMNMEDFIKEQTLTGCTFQENKAAKD